MTSPIVEGEASWIQEIHQRYHRPLFAFFKRRVRSAADAEDLVQEVFCRLLKRSQTTQEELPAAYIFTIAANLVRDQARKQESGVTGSVAGLEQQLYEVALRAGVPFDPERILAGKESLRELRSAMRMLNDRTRTILLLERIEKLPRNVIAESLGISLSSVEKHLKKALASLSERLRKL